VSTRRAKTKDSKPETGTPVFTDHLPVASGRSQETRPSTQRMELLDREILPRLERPGRFVAAPRTRGLDNEPACATRAALVWPSEPESNARPEALEPVSMALEALWATPPAFACLPTVELATALREHSLVPFTSDRWTPLTDHPAWLVWLEDPAQLLGVMTLLEGSGFAWRAKDRDGDAPQVILAGPAVTGLRAATIIGDEVWTESASLCALRLERGEPVAEGPDELALTTALSPAHAQSLREPLHAWAVDRGGVDRLLLHIWSSAKPASDRLRELQRVLRERPELTVAARFALGQPGENDADRWAIVDWAETFRDEVELEAPRLTIQLVGYIDPTSEGAPLALRPWYDALSAELRGQRFRVELGDPSANWRGWLLHRLGESAADVLALLFEEGARSAESVLSHDVDLWHKALQAVDFDGREFMKSMAETSCPRRPAPVARAPIDARNATDTGEPAPGDARPGAAHEEGTRSRADRWRRWASIAPRHFDYRLEYSKRGRWRHLSQRELAELILEVAGSLGLPVATMGVAQRRPRISFGPSLPAGVEGLHEYVDLSFTKKHRQLRSAVRDRLPDGIDILDVRFRPRAAQGLGLGEIARGQYCAHIPVGSIEGLDMTELRRRCESVLKDARRARAAMAANPGLAPDTIHQLVELKLDEEDSTASTVPLQFTLRLDGEGKKLKPIELLERLLAEFPLDTRSVPLQRVRLLAAAENGQEWITPMEQISRHLRELKARAKSCA